MFFHRRHRGKPLPGTLQRLRRGHRFEPGLRECLRDGSGWPDAACTPLWVRPRLCAINCVPTWSRPHRSRLSSPGDGAGSRSCKAATCVGARLSRSRTVPIRSQSQQLHYSSRTRRPLGSPGRARDHFGDICRHVFWWRTCHDAGGTAADCSRRYYPQRHRSRDGATGLDGLKSYVGKLPTARNFEEGAEILRWLFEAQFTKLAPQDWVAFAQRTWREGHGTLVPSHDPKLARALRGFSLERLPTLWDQFDALARIPLMVIRGANSDMLARPTLNEMLARRGQLEVVVVPDQGHAPLLAEPNVMRRVAAFVASCDALARD